MNNTNKEIPDPKKHKTVSLVKSTIRMIGYILLIYSIPTSIGVLVLSEVLGVMEEMV